jgi:hypothetical protein
MFFRFLRLFLPQTPLFLEKTAENLAAGRRQNAADALDTMIQTRIVQQVKQRIDRAGLRIGCPINDHRDSGLKDRAGAHRAWFERHIERAAVETPRLTRFGRLGNGDHFGVCRRIVELLALVMRPCDQPPFAYDDRADRHLVFAQGLLGLFQGDLHEMVVHGVGEVYSNVTLIGSAATFEVVPVRPNAIMRSCTGPEPSMLAGISI